MFAKDESGAYNLLPIKEQCGVTDPYVISYGEEAGTMRDFTWADTCACVRSPRKFTTFCPAQTDKRIGHTGPEAVSSKKKVSKGKTQDQCE